MEHSNWKGQKKKLITQTHVGSDVRSIFFPNEDSIESIAALYISAIDKAKKSSCNMFMNFVLFVLPYKFLE
jgi:hypothetical protein